MEGKAAVLGSPDFVMPFSALGMDTFSTEPEGAMVQEKAETIIRQKYALVIVAENVARAAQTVFERTQRNATPCVVVAPFTSEPTGVATESLGKMLKMATGINILK
jgi:V/A-type H+-transporting ATPase subunit F